MVRVASSLLTDFILSKTGFVKKFGITTVQHYNVLRISRQLVLLFTKSIITMIKFLPAGSQVWIQNAASNIMSVLICFYSRQVYAFIPVVEISRSGLCRSKQEKGRNKQIVLRGPHAEILNHLVSKPVPVLGGLKPPKTGHWGSQTIHHSTNHAPQSI